MYIKKSILNFLEIENIKFLSKKIFFACKFTNTGQIEYTKKVVELCRETIEQI
jgi:hypothetical protein